MVLQPCGATAAAVSSGEAESSSARHKRLLTAEAVCFHAKHICIPLSLSLSLYHPLTLSHSFSVSLSLTVILSLSAIPSHSSVQRERERECDSLCGNSVNWCQSKCLCVGGEKKGERKTAATKQPHCWCSETSAPRRATLGSFSTTDRDLTATTSLVVGG